MIKPGTILQDRYFVGQQIGSGGMGAVYLAIDHRFESQVAIKETYYNDETLRGAFEREARLLNSLHHSALPHVSDFFIEDDTHFLVMEHIEGADLSEILKDGAPLPTTDVLRWTSQLLDALEYLHSQNPPVIHRDIKPHNLKITPRNDVILLDFGLAKLETLDDQEERSIFGYSRTYSPLEQIEGTGTDARSDIFSLAATAYHLLTGRPPVNALKRVAAIVSTNVDPLKPASSYNHEVSPALDDILQTALALDSNNRFSSAIAMRTAIEYALGENFEKIAEIKADRRPAEADSTIAPIDEIFKEPVVPASAAANVDSLPNSEDTSEIKSNVLREVNRRQQISPPSFFVPVLDGRMAANYRKFAPLALLFFVLASGLTVWSFIDPKAASNEQAQAAAEPEKQVLPAAIPPLKTESAPEPESQAIEPDINSPVAEKKSNPVRQNSLPLPLAERKEISPPKKSVVKTEASVPSAAIPKEANPPKSTALKTTPKQDIATTKVIIVPNSALTRPRVISKRAASKSRESSASEINRFLIGKP